MTTASLWDTGLLVRARSAYEDRSRIVHADWGVDTTGDDVTFVWMRRSARKKLFMTEEWPATAEEVHKVARDLESVGVDAIDLMGDIPGTRCLRAGPARTAE
jgi:hypothetical protein